MPLGIADDCADVIDAIANKGLEPRSYSGRFMYGRSCVACAVEAGGDMEGLPKAGAKVDQLGRGYIVYWPALEWTPDVERYVGLILDISGKSEDDE